MKPSSRQTSSPRNPDRRQVLQGFAGAAAQAGLGAGGNVWAQAGKEAPALAKLVSEGKLPPLAQRVGSNPLVVKADKVGVYGGGLRRGLRGSADHNGILRMVGNRFRGLSVMQATRNPGIIPVSRMITFFNKTLETLLDSLLHVG